ncbi:MAG: NAD-dependent epimerase/dehydratase family protein [Gemmataceae bacterium]
MEVPTESNFWKGRPVVVVGGTGFLGFQIVKCLVSAGASVRSVSLPAPAEHPIHAMKSVEVESADLRNPAVAREMLANSSMVFQAAGPVSVGKASRHGVMNEHAEMTRVLLDAKPRECRLVHTSSIVAVGATAKGDVFDENSPFPLNGFRVEYVRGKKQAEDVALAGDNVVVTNPGYLFGPEDFGLSVMGHFCNRYWRGRIPFSPGGGISVVDVRDVAVGHLLAAEKGTVGRRYILSGENLTYPDLLRKLADASRYHPRMTLRTPAWLMTMLAAGAELRGKMTGKTPFPSFEHARLNRLFWFVSSALAESELGFRARPISVTLADAFAWHTAQSPYRLRGFNQWWFRQAA